MKKIILSFFLVVICHLGYSYNLCISDKEKVDIEEHPSEEPNKDRSIKNVECYLSRSDNTIEVEYSGIGTPVVYILDINGNILSYNQSNCISNNITISLPQTEGTYNVIIQSQIYYGIGVFYIY